MRDGTGVTARPASMVWSAGPAPCFERAEEIEAS